MPPSPMLMAACKGGPLALPRAPGCQAHPATSSPLCLTEMAEKVARPPSPDLGRR